MRVSFVASFAGRPGTDLQVGKPTAATAELLGNVWVCGRPFNTNTVARLDPDGDRGILEDALRSLDGWFGLIAVGNRKCVLATDILGTGGAFYSTSGKGTVVGTSLGRTASLMNSLEYDPMGVTSVLAGSVFLDRRTPFKRIRRLRAGEYAIIDLHDASAPDVRSYMDPAETLMSSDTGHSANELADILANAVSRETPNSRTGLLLTAGKDSRAIGYALDSKIRSQMTAYTYGGWRSTDRRLSGNAANELAIRHRRVGPMRLNIRHQSERVAGAGGQAGLQVAQHLSGAASLPQEVDLVMVGYLGDILSGKPIAESWDGQQRLVHRRNLTWIKNSDVSLDEEFPAAMDYIRSHLNEQLDSYRDMPPGRAATLVELTTRQANYIAGAFMLMHEIVEVASPFFNRDLMSYLFSLPYEALADQRLYNAMLEQQATHTHSRKSPIDRLAGLINTRGRPYGTVNWPKIIERERGWLRSRLAPYAKEDRVARLGIRSLEGGATFPLALRVIPLVETMHAAAAPGTDHPRQRFE